MFDENRSSYLPANSQSFFTLQMLKGDRRFVSFYEGPEHIPYCITRMVCLEECQPFLDSDKGPVTFTVRVPLSIVMCGRDAICEHIEKTAFTGPIKLHSCEYRPVGACIAEFDTAASGDVLLQVTCSMSLASD